MDRNTVAENTKMGTLTLNKLAMLSKIPAKNMNIRVPAIRLLLLLATPAYAASTVPAIKLWCGTTSAGVVCKYPTDSAAIQAYFAYWNSLYSHNSPYSQSVVLTGCDGNGYCTYIYDSYYLGTLIQSQTNQTIGPVASTYPNCPAYSTLTGTVCTCGTGYVADPTATLCIPIPACLVDPLTPITDPVALLYEDGTYDSTNPDVAHLNQATQTGLGCIQQKVAALNCYMTPRPTSGYRPDAYQKHIYDVYYKWQKIKNDNTPACAEIKAAIKNEFRIHSTFKHAPGPTSNHSQLDVHGNPAGNVVDIDFVPDNIFDSADAIACQCNMYRPMISNSNPKRNDPVHYESRTCPH